VLLEVLAGRELALTPPPVAFVREELEEELDEPLVLDRELELPAPAPERTAPFLVRPALAEEGGAIKWGLHHLGLVLVRVRIRHRSLVDSRSEIDGVEDILALRIKSSGGRKFPRCRRGGSALGEALNRSLR